MYYHGSKNPDIKELTIDKSNDGYVWLIENFACAVAYAGSGVRFWAVDSSGKPALREVCEDCVKKMYKGVKCYIYCIADQDVGEYERCDYKGRKIIRLTHNVKVTNVIKIDDAYEEIMRLYKDGEIKICFWNDRPETERQEDQKRVKAALCGDMSLKKKERPEDYATLIKLFPDTELKEM